MGSEYMNGKFFMSDVYGGIFGTTEMTIPEAADKQALVDDNKSDNTVDEKAGVNTKGIVGSILLIVCVALVLGAVK